MKRDVSGIAPASFRAFFVDVGVGLTTSHLVGVNPMLEKREEVECGFEVPDMGGAGIRDQSKWVLFCKLSSQGHPFG